MWQVLRHERISGNTAPLQSSYTIKIRAAGQIGTNTGVKTVWNQGLSPQVGRVFYMTFPRGEHTLQLVSDVFIDPVQKNLLDAENVGGTFHYEVSSKPNVSAQLNWLGIQAKASSAPVKTISFDATGGTEKTLKWFSNSDVSFVDLLNNPSYGVKLRRVVYKDMAGRRSPADSHFWVVTTVLTAKDLTISTTDTHNASVGVTVSDSTALAAKVGATAASIPTGGFNAGDQSSSNGKLIFKGEYPLAVEIQPLSAKKDADGTIILYVTDVSPPRAVNTLKGAAQ